MSVKNLQIRKRLQKELKKIIQEGDPPQSNRISFAVGEYFSRRAAGAPRFWPQRWTKNKAIPVDKYNQNLDEIEEDLSVLFEDSSEIDANAVGLEAVLSQEISSVESKLNRLNSKIANMMLRLKPASGFAVWHTEDFSSMQYTDSSKTTAVIDSEYRKLGMPVSSISTSLIKREDIFLGLISSEKYETVSPLELALSPYQNENAEIIISSANKQANVVIEVRFKRDVRLSRIRLNAASKAAYGLRVEAESDSGQTQVLHDSMVSYPIQIPSNAVTSKIKFSFSLVKPFLQEEDINRFRLIISELNLFEDVTHGEATWSSTKIKMPDSALLCRADWSASLDSSDYINAVAEVYSGNSETPDSSFPISNGDVFPIRGASKQSKPFSESIISKLNINSTLPLWSTSNLISPSVGVIDPVLWIGKDQWKQRIFHSDWTESLAPQHMPQPEDWASFRESAVETGSEYTFYSDMSSNTTLGNMPANKNVLIALSTHLKAKKDATIFFPAFSTSGINFSFYSNGQKITDSRSWSNGSSLRVNLYKGWNSIQIYMFTKSSSPAISFGSIVYPSDLFIVGEKDSAIFVDINTIRKASPAHPRTWVALHDNNIVFRFPPKLTEDSATHLKCLFEYGQMQDTSLKEVVLSLRLSKQRNTPGAGPIVNNISLSASPL